jgi:hypothetical protein
MKEKKKSFFKLKYIYWKSKNPCKPEIKVIVQSDRKVGTKMCAATLSRMTRGTVAFSVRTLSIMEPS